MLFTSLPIRKWVKVLRDAELGVAKEEIETIDRDCELSSTQPHINKSSNHLMLLLPYRVLWFSRKLSKDYKPISSMSFHVMTAHFFSHCSLYNESRELQLSTTRCEILKQNRKSKRKLLIRKFLPVEICRLISLLRPRI